MYFRTRDLPGLSNLNYAARKALISEAIIKYGGAKAFRYSVAFSPVFVLSVIVGIVSPLVDTPPWFIWVFSLTIGLLFYVYLLWEINSSTAAAVKKLLEERQYTSV